MLINDDHVEATLSYRGAQIDDMQASDLASDPLTSKSSALALCR